MTSLYRLLGDEISGENKQFVLDYFDALSMEESLNNLKSRELSRNRFETIELKNLDLIQTVAQKYLGLDLIYEDIFSLSDKIAKTGGGLVELFSLMEKISGHKAKSSETIKDDEYSQKIAKLNNLLDNCRKSFYEEKKT